MIEMVEIPGGTFLMGSREEDKDSFSNEYPQHEVIVPAFLMGKYPITQYQYEAVMGDNPSNFKGANRPVECVSWFDAVVFCQKLSQQSGKDYRLPSEAEWEYACRAGTTTSYYFGESLDKNQANFDSGSTTDVGHYPPNDFGLYDMHGNVWEWCLDHWHGHYQGAPTDGKAWTTGGYANTRIMRGGSWNHYPRRCRSASRLWYEPDNQSNYIGFRIAHDA
jgi:formylglycine-generating enzyme required for sulfatase activity